MSLLTESVLLLTESLSLLTESQFDKRVEQFRQMYGHDGSSAVPTETPTPPPTSVCRTQILFLVLYGGKFSVVTGVWKTAESCEILPLSKLRQQSSQLVS